MAVKLLFNEHKRLLKCSWKVEKVVEVQRRCRIEFGTPLPTRVTITRIRDKFQVDGTVQDVLKGRCRNGSAKEFHPRYPDSTHLDFYFCGTLKNTVYATKPQTLEELRSH